MISCPHSLAIFFYQLSLYTILRHPRHLPLSDETGCIKTPMMEDTVTILLNKTTGRDTTVSRHIITCTEKGRCPESHHIYMPTVTCLARYASSWAQSPQLAFTDSSSGRGPKKTCATWRLLWDRPGEHTRSSRELGHAPSHANLLACLAMFLILILRAFVGNLLSPIFLFDAPRLTFHPAATGLPERAPLRKAVASNGDSAFQKPDAWDRLPTVLPICIRASPAS